MTYAMAMIVKEPWSQLSHPLVFKCKQDAIEWARNDGWFDADEIVKWPVTVNNVGFYEVSDENISDRV